ERQLQALRLPFWVGQNEIGSVGVHRVAHQFAVEVGAAGFRITQSLECVKTSPLGDDDAIAIFVKGSRRSGWIDVGRQRVLTVETGEDTERMNAFARSARNG